MSDNLRGIEHNVQFNWTGAERLVAELRANAEALSSQIPSRNAAADGALQEWRGRYAHEFEGRMRTCSGDAARLADALRLAARFDPQVYEPRASGGVDVNAVLGPRSPFPDELEIAYPGGIEPHHVVGVTTPSGEWIPNPGYGVAP